MNLYDVFLKRKSNNARKIRAFAIFLRKINESFSITFFSPKIRIEDF